jgi:hypothetical protein
VGRLLHQQRRWGEPERTVRGGSTTWGMFVFLAHSALSEAGGGLQPSGAGRFLVFFCFGLFSGVYLDGARLGTVAFSEATGRKPTGRGLHPF